MVRSKDLPAIRRATLAKNERTIIRFEGVRVTESINEMQQNARARYQAGTFSRTTKEIDKDASDSGFKIFLGGSEISERGHVCCPFSFSWLRGL